MLRGNWTTARCVTKGATGSSSFASPFRRHMHHLRYALRTLGRNPLFAVAAVLTIAIAIGANTAIFSVVDYTLLRGTPGVRDETRLATISVDGQLDGGISIAFGVPYRAY